MIDNKLPRIAFFTSVLALSLSGCGGSGETSIISLQEPAVYASVAELGSDLFVDTNLSNNRTQSCATCHAAGRAFTDPRHHSRGNGTVAVLARTTGVSVGDDGVSVGSRNAPTAMYAALTPEFGQDENGYFGGQFWDGRASTLADQAGGPPLNPVEMQMPDKASVIARIQENEAYVTAFQKFYGLGIFNDTDAAYTAMTQAIASFEKTAAFQPFDSKWDFVIAEGDETLFSSSEQNGYQLFTQHCISCHNSADSITNSKQTFTNYRYYNLAVEDNPEISGDDNDQGLYENPNVTETSEIGKFKTPTLRNVAVTAPYMHNGVYKDLQTAIAFFNNDEINLSSTEINDLECFLRTLTDSAYESLLPTTRTDGSSIICN